MTRRLLLAAVIIAGNSAYTPAAPVLDCETQAKLAERTIAVPGLVATATATVKDGRCQVTMLFDVAR